MCAEYKAYDYFIVRQQLFKFFEEKHTKVSLFIQDGIQGLDGTIYLDFCGIGPLGSRKPGSITMYDPESGNKIIDGQKNIKLMHSDRWEVNPNQGAKVCSSRPYLGGNLYAADRVKPSVPFKPTGNEDKVIEEIRAKKIEIEERDSKVKKTEGAMTQSETNATTTEFNLLANLICAPADDDFKLNLFPEQFGFSSQANSKDQKEDDQNIISIDLG